MDDDVSAIVIDIGKLSVKAGWAGDDHPRSVFPTVVSRPRKANNPALREHYVGDEAMLGRLKPHLNLRRRQDFTKHDKELLYDFLFWTEFRRSPQDHCVLLSRPPNQNAKEDEEDTQLLFEYSCVPALSLQDDAALSLFTVGRTTGIAVTLGSSCRVTPVYESSTLRYATQTNQVSGDDLTKYLHQLIATNDSRFDVHDAATSDHNSRLFLEELRGTCFVASDYTQESKKWEGKQFDELKPLRKCVEFPGGGAIAHVQTERFECPEALFNPSRLDGEYKGKALQYLVYDAVCACPALKDDLLKTISLSGGPSSFPGIGERLQTELTTIFEQWECPHFGTTADVLGKDKSSLFSKVPMELRNQTKGYIAKKTPLKVLASPDSDRKYGAWIGGSILASLSIFQRQWVTKEMYDELGASVVHYSCY